MRLTRCHLYLLVALMIAIVGPAVFSQQGSGRGRGGFGKGGGKMAFDPNGFWDQVSQGKDSFNINDAAFPPQMQPFANGIIQRWSTYLQSRGITDGVMTKARYDEMSQASQQQRAQFVGQSFGGGKGGGGKGKMRGMGGPGGGPGAGASFGDPKEEDVKIDEEARQFFTQMDTNQDGFLDKEEGRWVRNFDRYDLNKDGKLSLDEYIESYRDAQAQRGRGTRGIGQANIIQGGDEPPEEEKRPVVYRAGKLPKELPKWFTDLDRDNDGQVGLYEWLADSRSVPEFQAMDANADGFLTVEEVLRFQRATQKDKPAGPGGIGVGGLANAGQPGAGMGRFGRQQWGNAAAPGGAAGPAMQGRGRGGPGGGGQGRGAGGPGGGGRRGGRGGNRGGGGGPGGFSGE